MGCGKCRRWPARRFGAATDFRRTFGAMTDPRRANTFYKVVVNHEEQYRVQRAHLEVPAGWRDAGMTGTEAECQAYVKARSGHRSGAPRAGDT